MNGNYPKRLIEVDLPIRRISEHARREKSIRQGHISTLHIWWARRPLAACRAVLCASLWPDPVDPDCPKMFRTEARAAMGNWAKNNVRLSSAESAERFLRIRETPALLDDNTELRNALLDFIADFANWDNTNSGSYLETSRSITRAAHTALDGSSNSPLVVDPFAGGGAIPLEALRVGADAFASDLNPVPYLLNKVILEYLPRYGQRLVEAVKEWGEWVRRESERELSAFYPGDPDGASPIAYLWARTILCEGPGCGAEVPLIRTLWLGKKPHNSWSLRILPDKKHHKVDFEVVRGAKPSEVGKGTVASGSVLCPCCGYTTPATSVRKQLSARNGGTASARLVCVVTKRPNEQGRYYRLPISSDLDAIGNAERALRKKEGGSHAISVVPDEPLPPQGTLGFRVQLYGMKQWGQLFLPRQALALSTLSEKVKAAREHLEKSYKDGLADAVQVALALNLDKMADYGSSLSSWLPQATQETVAHTFARPTLSMIWDFAEAYPFVSSSGGWMHNLSFLVSPLAAEATSSLSEGRVHQGSATRHPLPDDSVDAFVTDPPYYDAIPYADLSDYFVVWLKRSLQHSTVAPEFQNLSPKDEECVVDETKGHDRAFFEKMMGRALTEGRRITKPGGLGVVVFAHKATGAWETLLQSMIDAGWVITGSWPIDTERGSRLRAMSSAALASSVHLVCRPREYSAKQGVEVIGDWRDVLQELPTRIHQWMPRLAEEGVVGADAIFACLGPALEIFSQYSRVEKASGETVTLREYLEHVWAAVAKEALTAVFKGADASGFEEDARLTAMWLWTLSAGQDGDGTSSSEEMPEDEDAANATPSGYVLEYDVARKIAQGLGAHLDTLTSLVEIKGETARLLAVTERTRKLFGKDEADAPTTTRKKKAPQLQLEFVAELEQAEESGSWGNKGVPSLGVTVLDRVHQSMILFAAGRGEALRRFLVEEGAGRDERFWRLAQVLSYLYPKTTDEKRWIDGVLARKKGLGF